MEATPHDPSCSLAPDAYVPGKIEGGNVADDIEAGCSRPSVSGTGHASDAPTLDSGRSSRADARLP